MDVRPGEPERLGVTRLQRDLNFAAAVPENRDCSLLLYKKGSAKITIKSGKKTTKVQVQVTK